MPLGAGDCTRSSSARTSGRRSAQPGLTAKIMLGTMSNGDTSRQGRHDRQRRAWPTRRAKPYIKGIGLQWGMLDQVVSAPSTSIRQPADLADRAQVRQLPLGSRRTFTQRARRRTIRRTASRRWGYIRDCDQGGRHRVQRLEHGARHGRQGHRRDAQLAAERAADGRTRAKTLTSTPAYYVFRHFSQYVAAGRQASSRRSGGDALAFKNPDGSIVAVMYNSGGANDELHRPDRRQEAAVRDARQRLGDRRRSVRLSRVRLSTLK